jgi:hypothetical protein
MKLIKYLSLTVIAIAAFTTSSVSAKTTIVPKIYAFGFSASFNDSIVFFTNIQTIDSAYIDSKSKFLLSRDNYSYQLKGYLEDQLALKNRTCMIFFAFKQKDIEKKYMKMKHKYTAKGNFDVRYISNEKFHFQRIDLNVEEVDSAAEVAAKKAEEMKKLDKKRNKGMRPQGKPNGQGGPGGPGGPEGGSMEGGSMGGGMRE